MLAWLRLVTLTGRELIGCLLFVRNYLPAPDLDNWFTAHFWSLSVEEHFYLFWPLILLVFSPASARKVAVVLAIGVPIWRKVDIHYHLISPYGMGRTDWTIDALLWGAFLALLVHPPEKRALIARWLTPTVWCGIVLTLMATTWFQPPGYLALQAFLMPWMILGTVLNPHFWWSGVLESRVFRWVGRLSYSLYIWQQLCISGIWPRIEILPYFPGTAANLLLGFVATFLLGAISHYALERPLMRAGKRLLSGKVRRPPLVSSSLDS